LKWFSNEVPSGSSFSLFPMEPPSILFCPSRLITLATRSIWTSFTYYKYIQQGSGTYQFGSKMPVKHFVSPAVIFPEQFFWLAYLLDLVKINLCMCSWNNENRSWLPGRVFIFKSLPPPNLHQLTLSHAFTGSWRIISVGLLFLDIPRPSFKDINNFSKTYALSCKITYIKM
jgi:hypothetical protein